MQDIIKFQGTKTVESINAKTGATTSRVQRAAEFKVAFKASNPKASNREIKKAYEAYYRAEVASVAKGFDFQKAIAAAQSGQLGIERVTCNADGDKTTVVFVDLTKGEESSVEETLKGMSVSDMQKALEYLSRRLNDKPMQETVMQDSPDFQNCPE